MRDFNSLTVIGRLGNDPKPFGSGDTAGCSFSLASNNSVKQGDGWVDVASWFNVSLYGKAAEFTMNSVKKGARVLVSGRISTRAYKKDDGTQCTAVDIRGSEITLIENKRPEDCPI